MEERDPEGAPMGAVTLPPGSFAPGTGPQAVLGVAVK